MVEEKEDADSGLAKVFPSVLSLLNVRPGQIHQDDPLIQAWPKAEPGFLWYSMLQFICASTLYLLCQGLALAKSTINGPFA